MKDNTPIRCKPYPLLYSKREDIWNEVGSMLEIGEMRPSTLPYASPSIMVKKKDGSNRVYVDCRKLIMEVDTEIIVIAEDLFCQPSSKKYLSKIDLTKDTG